MAPSLPRLDVHVAVLPRAGLPLRLVASEAECLQVAQACGVRRVASLEADLDIRRWRGDGVEIAGEVRASLEQECVVTLAPVSQRVVAPVEATFLPRGSPLDRSRSQSEELVLDPEGPDIPETFVGEAIDVWPLVVEFLLLAIDPWPRAPGAVLDPKLAGGEDGDAAPQSPFSVLAALRKDPT
ncbi:MAG: metal-binding protein [Alphaproteobacteria bacterium]|nr:MAG: metal-binding protein [Alphaproteobacteria bacterium]